MASRDNQNMQIAVISLSILLILLVVGLFLINNERNKEAARADQQTQRASDATNAATSAQGEANSYKLMMGFREEDSQETVRASFDEDMEKYGSSFEEAVRFYSPLLENLQLENHKLELSESGAKENLRKINQQLRAIEKEKNEQIAEFEAEAKSAKEDLAAERAKFAQQRDEMLSEREELASQLAAQRQQATEMTSQMSTMEKNQQQQLTSLGRDIELLRSNQLDPDPFAQPADGMIRWVNQKEQMVWINIGEADHLRPQVSFSVYSGDESDAAKAEKKGSIEVSKILSPHMAEARITSDDPTRPLQEGDKIYSQVWNRGRQVGFAIAGFVDLDGDTVDDRDELKSIINVNNGKVDAEPGEGGLVEGEMTVGTRFLILGDYPENTLPNSESLRSSWVTLTQSADQLGIDTITLDEFLRLMGWQPDRKTVPLGATGRPQDFRAKPLGDVLPRQSKAGTGDFIPRKPEPTY